MKHIIIFLCVLFFTAACSKEDIPTYDATNYVQFTSDYTDSLEISFFFYPGQDQLEIPLEFKLLGQLLSEEADFTIDIVKEATTATEQYYDLPESPRFAKESVYDRKTLILHNPGEHTFRLVLEVKSGSRLLAGQLAYTRKVIWYSNEVMRPQWWDKSVEDAFLGPYTKTKFETLVKVTKVGDWTNLSPDQRLAQARKLKYYLREMETAGTPVKDENDQNMTVPVMG